MLTAEIVRELLDYNPNTGVLTWKERSLHHFKSIGDCNAWNARFANTEAGTLNSNGYLMVRTQGKGFLAHRVIWLWMTGQHPKDQIDHLNHKKLDNRWVNLREASNAENMRNQSLFSTNTSGFVGVHFKKTKKRWVATIVIENKHLYLGSFREKADAVAARQSAALAYGFHENHGT